eukprot:CAMPEP_0118632240 /NCGR_PEP_ID=MMETSP0785-20121206/335_1 /TAXON_ID=91992 /ORGANISM="Bolidomonas pacifica, Strain CCMP 1866" /LENGTH=349 /DNA_ID=CAMNT_0006522989 /DNA_START=18 /DNA_END=1064 /DNA_ORIENTATION=+
MDASALVSGSNARPTLGKVSVGPLGTTHEEMLEAILRKQRRSNPLKVVNDAINDCFMGIFRCCDLMIPTRVNPEMGADERNTVRPHSAEAVAILSCMGFILFVAALFFWQVAETASTSADWEGGATCVVLDKIRSSSGDGTFKLIMKAKNDTNGLISSELKKRWDDFEPHHEELTPKDNPLSCHVLKSEVESGPCCHSSYNAYNGIEIGDIVEECFVTFNTEYCNTVEELIEDDDFRGFGKDAPQESSDGFSGNSNEVFTDHINKMCCEPELPISVAGVTLLFILGCTIAAVVLWCLFFRARRGVWSRLCPFESQPTNAHIYDATPSSRTITKAKKKKNGKEDGKADKT